MFSQKQETQNTTESEAYKQRLNYGAEKEKQIMNQIRANAVQRQNSSSWLQSTLGGGTFELSFNKK
ncbi:hypothetical protein DAMA08_023090 [Martiniozyma asiatica (nom. inval.)]|nr:hypothetical protein DAMA08_023090 [Martiniozyma asiatica]